MSTSARILIAFLVLLFGGLVYLARDLTLRVERQYMEAAEEPMVDAAYLFASLVEQFTDDRGIQVDALRKSFARAHERRFSAKIYNFEKTKVKMHLYVTDADGLVLYDSRGEAEGQNYRRMLDVGRSLKGIYGARSSRTNESNDRSSILYVSAPVTREGKIVGVVSVSKPQADMFPFMEATQEHIRWMALSSFVAIALIASLFTSWLATPIRKLTAYARQLGQGERRAVPKLRSREARLLGEAFEDLRDKLEGRQYVEGYVRTLTHEMKSPIAAIKGAAELLQEDMPPERREHFLSNIDAETARMQDVIDRLLALSTVENRKTLEAPERLNVSQLVREVIESHDTALENCRLTLETDLPPDLWVRGDAALLEMALSNLLQNAIEFSPPGEAIQIRASSDQSNGLVITVKDHGPGIPTYALERAFDHFYSLQRPNSGKKSSGLGLCIVREIMELHGGSATLENVADHGALATVRFPQEEVRTE
ncbi:MAG: two-component system sensor histidine kinase CreC [Verrucomicrobiaceae bacterium]|nr:two-component system sensor histidine kinase CreC [Verrucomicrobiaceae bacterium]